MSTLDTEYKKISIDRKRVERDQLSTGLMLAEAILSVDTSATEQPTKDTEKTDTIEHKDTSATPVVKRDIVVCIDPGHGRGSKGGDNFVQAGANKFGVEERTINWEVATRVSNILKSKGITVVMTKDSVDEQPSNIARSKVANENNAAIMVRLHADDAGPSASGFTVYAPDRAGRFKESTGKVAVGPSPGILHHSMNSARLIEREMSKHLSGFLKCNGVKGESVTNTGAQHGGASVGSIYFRGKENQGSVVLIEMCNMANRSDLDKLTRDGGYDKVAEAIADGILASQGVS